MRDLLRRDAANPKGVKFDLDGSAEGLSYSFAMGQNDVLKSQGVLMLEYDGHHGMDAAAALFHVNHNDARYFFDPQCYDTTPTEAEGVAQRIDDFLNGKIDRNSHPNFCEGECEEDESDDESDVVD